MIKLKSVKRTLNETILSFDYDLEDEILSVDIDEKDLNERLKLLRELLGRELTYQDLKDVIKSIIASVRKGKYEFPQRFDYSSLINMDLESQ